MLKTNDTIFYASWLDYFKSLLLHNFLFPDTAYKLLGFHVSNEVLYSVVEQVYIATQDTTDLKMVELFLKQNGFRRKRNNDYINDEWGIILEDLHDENVLTKEGYLFFIDTVFYVLENDWFKDNIFDFR